MATFDQLSAEQRAIVELVLQQGKSYEELAGMLGMPEARVRELARDALVELAPVSAGRVEEDWRGQLADYVLGQQAGPEATATKGHLRRSEPARTWARSLLDSLEQLYPNGSMPAIPEGERGGRGRAVRAVAAPGDGAPPAGERGPDATAAVRRRRLLAAAAAAAAVVLVAVLVWPVGVLTGGDDGGDQSQAAGTSGGGQQAVSAQTRGQAIIARQTGRPQIIVTATGLPPSTQRSAYQVWLYNSEQDRKSIGAQVTDAQGNLQAGGPLPGNYQRFRFIDVTEVAVNGNNFRTGKSVLRGALQLRDKPVTRGTGKKRITLLADIQLAPV
ncbi:MAG TPA: anti-sigma factor [Thermoleophilaceae bacterium]